METVHLKIPRGYDPKTQSRVGLFAAQLDNQLAHLKKHVKGLTVEQLEWQPRPGMNSVGMLLVHNAIVEVWWIKLAPAEIPWSDEVKDMFKKICGVEDDGMPLPPDGTHPAFLKGFTAEKYLSVIASGRRAIHKEMKKWRDRDLNVFYDYKAGQARFTRTWTLYHVLEHFCSHFGQILLMKHMMRDAGVLAKEDEPPKG